LKSQYYATSLAKDDFVTVLLLMYDLASVFRIIRIGNFIGFDFE